MMDKYLYKQGASSTVRLRARNSIEWDGKAELQCDSVECVLPTRPSNEDSG